MAHRVRRSLRIAAMFAAVVLLAVCDLKKLPTAPSDLTAGIVIYQHANFAGKSAYLDSDVSDLSDYEGPCEHSSYSGQYSGSSTYYDWEDCISSIRVAPGWRATVYVDAGFHDDRREVTADEPNLALVPGPCKHDTWNDCISSIRVRAQ